MNARWRALLQRLSLFDREHRSVRFVQDGVVLLLMCVLLYYGASWQIFKSHTDAASYQCYALAFWHGLTPLPLVPSNQCAFLHDSARSSTLFSQDVILHTLQRWGMPAGLIQFVAEQSAGQPLHALPHEYPLLVLLPFSLALFVPAYWYQVAFAGWMLLLAVGMYVLLRRSRGAALACALYLIAGGWATMAGRFDAVPSLLTLGALLCALHRRWHWAFALLALATLFKFYPLVLLIPFLLARQQEVQGRWYARRRWSPLAVYVLLGVLVTMVSLLLSVEGTLSPLSYFQSRPVQVESLGASLLWLGSFLGAGSLTYAYTYGSLNVFSPLSAGVSAGITVLLVAGLFYVYWLQWRARLDLARACLLVLLVIIVASKVFSPQYLIWVIPFVAYIGRGALKWLVPWTLVGLLTTWIYPYLYLMRHRLEDVPTLPLFYPVVTLRNLLLFALTLSLLVYYSRNKVLRRSEPSPDLPTPASSTVVVVPNP